MAKVIKGLLLIIILICTCVAIYIGYSHFYLIKSKKTDDNSQKMIADKQKGQKRIKEQEEEQQKEQEDKKQQDLEALYKNGYDEYNSHNYTNCVNIENQVIAQDSNFYKAYTIKGIAQCFSNNYEEGSKNLDKALQIKDDYGYGRYAKALSLELYAHYDEALDEYNKALQIEQYVWSYYGMASIYGRRGDINNVVKYLKEAINLNPAVKGCAKTEEDFDNVRKYKEFQDLINN